MMQYFAASAGLPAIDYLVAIGRVSAAGGRIAREYAAARDLAVAGTPPPVWGRAVAALEHLHAPRRVLHATLHPKGAVPRGTDLHLCLTAIETLAPLWGEPADAVRPPRPTRKRRRHRRRPQPIGWEAIWRPKNKEPAQ